MLDVCSHMPDGTHIPITHTRLGSNGTSPREEGFRLGGTTLFPQALCRYVKHLWRATRHDVVLMCARSRASQPNAPAVRSGRGSSRPMSRELVTIYSCGGCKEIARSHAVRSGRGCSRQTLPSLRPVAEKADRTCNTLPGRALPKY